MNPPDLLHFYGVNSAFMKCEAKYPAIFGGIGSGKTTAAVMRGIDYALNNPKSHGALIRETYPQLRTTLLDVFLNQIVEVYFKDRVKKCNLNLNYLIFDNDSIVYFYHTGDPGLFKGPEFAWFIVDQAEDLKEQTADDITTRLRQPGYKKCGMFLGNTDKGHNYCWRWFKQGEKKRAQLYETTILDNIHNLDADYIEEMFSKPMDWQNIKLFGSWEAPGGTIWPFTKVHKIKRFRVPTAWPRYTMIDPPDSTGFCGALSGTKTPNGDYIILKEYLRKRRLVRDHSANIKNLWPRLWVDQYIMDSAAWRNQEQYNPDKKDYDFITVAQRYADFGINATTAMKNLDYGIDKGLDLLRVDPNHYHPFTGLKGSPRFFVVEESCPQFLEQVNDWQWADIEKEPIHLVDCARYFVATELIEASLRDGGEEDIDEEESLSYMAM